VFAAINVSASSLRASVGEAAEKIVPALQRASRGITEILKSRN
jgi:hypothetical protein